MKELPIRLSRQRGKLRARRHLSMTPLRFLTGPVMVIMAVGAMAVAIAPLPRNKPRNYPAWWFERGVIARSDSASAGTSWPGDYAATNDYSVLNQGQLKYIATAAFDEFQVRLPGGAGDALTSTIKTWYQLDVNGDFVLDNTGHRIPKSGGTASNFAAVNQGQAKAIAKLFYDRLAEAGFNGEYPWAGSDTAPANFAMANIGQAKNLFFFPFGDLDVDGLPDEWELKNGLSPEDSTDYETDLDGDGVSNIDEYINGTDPLLNPGNPPATSPPAAPSSVFVITDSDGGRYIYWTDASDNEDYFVIRDYHPDGTFVELGRVGPGRQSLYVPPSR